MDQVGPYRIVERLGVGTLTTSYKARHVRLGRYVTIRLMLPRCAADQGLKERFRRHVAAVANLDHHHILDIYDEGEEEGLPYLVTEFVDGGSLATRLGIPLAPRDVVGILAPIASALDHAHARGVLHRAVKPSNILLAQDGAPLLADFGVEGAYDDPMRSTLIAGAGAVSCYAPPEETAGASASEASDRYALAVVADQLLTGSMLPRHVAALLETAGEAPLGGPVADVMARALAASPTDRYANAGEFVAALWEVAALPTPADTSSRGARTGGQEPAPSPSDTPTLRVPPLSHGAAVSLPRRARGPWTAALRLVLGLALAVTTALGARLVAAAVYPHAPSSGSASREASAAPAAGTTLATPTAGLAPAPSASVVTTAPTAISAPKPGDVLLHDSLDDPARAVLPILSAASSRFVAEYEQGDYAIRTLDPELHYASVNVPEAYRDASLAVDARVVGETANRFVALGCRRRMEEGGESYDRLSVFPDEGMFLVDRGGKGVQTTLAPWQVSGAIRRGNDVNRLQIRCVGSLIEASINGTLVASLEDASSTVGQMWIATGSFPSLSSLVEAHFRNLEVVQG